MALSKLTADNPSSWSCGFECHVGIIWFSTLVVEDQRFPNYESRYLERLEHAVSTVTWDRSDSTEDHMHELDRHIFKSCYVIRGRRIGIGAKRYVLLKCVIRCNGIVYLSNQEKETYCRLLCQRLFGTYARLERDNHGLIQRASDRIFLRDDGFLLSNSHAIQMAFRSLCFTINKKAPITAETGGLWPLREGCNGHVRTFTLPQPVSGKAITLPVMVRSLVDDFIPPSPLRNIVKEGLCFAPACQNGLTPEKQEEWTVHLHTVEPYNLEGRRQPISLQNAARLAVYEACLKARRQKHNPRYSPYFRALYH
nr:GAM-1/protein ORF-1 [Pigeon adenovirus 1]